MATVNKSLSMAIAMDLIAKTLTTSLVYQVPTGPLASVPSLSSKITTRRLKALFHLSILAIYPRTAARRRSRTRAVRHTNILWMAAKGSQWMMKHSLSRNLARIAWIWTLSMPSIKMLVRIHLSTKTTWTICPSSARTTPLRRKLTTTTSETIKQTYRGNLKWWIS